MTNNQKLYDMYKEVLLEAQNMWMSEFCCSRDEAKERKAEDLKRLDAFKAILEEEKTYSELVD